MDQNFFGPNFFLPQNCFGSSTFRPKVFLTGIVFGSKSFWTYIFLTKTTTTIRTTTTTILLGFDTIEIIGQQMIIEGNKNKDQRSQG